MVVQTTYVMDNIEQTIKLWAKMNSPTEDQIGIARKRLGTCMGCSYWVNEPDKMQYCSECGCSTQVKVFSTIKSCPKDKWEI